MVPQRGAVMGVAWIYFRTKGVVGVVGVVAMKCNR